MKTLKDIFSQSEIKGIIEDLSEKSVELEDWNKLQKIYEPKLHSIVDDNQGRKDKVRSDGTIDKAARIHIGLEKLLVNRINEFTFSIPVKRVYSGIADSETRRDIAKAMEAVYKNSRINSENLKRGRAYYACCEAFTFWYAVEKPNRLYGFESKYKLKCKTYSPMDGTTLYPLFGETGDMLAMSFKYKRKVGDEEIVFFETYTESEDGISAKHYKWKEGGNNGWEEIINEDIILQKIPGVYIYREKPIYEGLEVLREQLEYTLSRDSDVIAYNSAPILKVSGAIKGSEDKGESRRIYRVENGGDVSYVSWNQSNDALNTFVDDILKLFFMQAQMPDISFENLKNLGEIGYDARMTLLMDAHLRIGDEKGAFIEMLERENNVIKAYLKLMNPKWERELEDMCVEHEITPFIHGSEKAEIEKWRLANGDKPVVSQLESIQYLGISNDPQNTYETIVNETKVATEASQKQVQESQQQ